MLFRSIRRLISSGAVGFAEGYLEGDWTTPSLPDLMRLAAHNDASMSDRTQGLWLSRLLNRLQHLANNNSRSRAKRNIAYHYDLGNDFYSAWLDDGMTYSSALFRHSDMSLMEAQAAKLDRLIEVADIQGHVSVLEIGCGWGSFLERAAGHTAGPITGISISERQCEYARQRLATRDIANATVAFRDYRDMTGTFDRIVSIEMFEAVGEAYWSLANLKTFRFSDSDIESMRKQVTAEGGDADDQSHLAFALGKALEEIGRAHV